MSTSDEPRDLLRSQINAQADHAYREPRASQEALVKFGRHLEGCRKAPRIINGIEYGGALPPEPCSCGLDDAICAHALQEPIIAAVLADVVRPESDFIRDTPQLNDPKWVTWRAAYYIRVALMRSGKKGA